MNHGAEVSRVEPGLSGQVREPVDNRSWRTKEPINLEMILVPVFWSLSRDEEPFAPAKSETLSRNVFEQLAHRLFFKFGFHSRF